MSTTLIEAAQKGDDATVRSWIGEDTDVNAQDKEGFTALFYAAMGGHTETVESLLEKGADVNVKNRNGTTALGSAAFYGDTAIAEALLAKGADVNVKEGKDGYTPLILAAAKGHTEIVKSLLEKGADVNVESKNGVTALGMAANAEVTRLLRSVEIPGEVRPINGSSRFSFHLSSLREADFPDLPPPMPTARAETDRHRSALLSMKIWSPYPARSYCFGSASSEGNKVRLQYLLFPVPSPMEQGQAVAQVVVESELGAKAGDIERIWVDALRENELSGQNKQEIEEAIRAERRS
jgi:hypothetical protein